jgi:heme exporter protein C
MKALLLSLGFIAGIAWGIFPGIDKPRPAASRLILFLLLTATVVLALFPYTAGSLADAVLAYRTGQQKPIPVLCRIDAQGAVKISEKEWSLPVLSEKDKPAAIRYTSDATALLPAQFGDNKPVIALLQRGSNDAEFILHGIVTQQPMITLPYIMGLEERARIIYFHVPMSWIAVLAYILAMVWSFKYLHTRNADFDIKASAAAALGTLFCVLATLTGAIWAKFNWGSFWNWDPRETSIFVLLLIYAAYFVLRSSIENPENRARLSAVYAIIAAVAAIFFIYIAPRIYGGLHPGSADDSNAGPVISQQDGTLNMLKQIILSLAFSSFTMLFYWMLNLSIRLKHLQKKIMYLRS